MTTLNETQTRRLQELLGETMEIQPGFANLPRPDAVEVVMLIEGVSQDEAEFRVALECGETTGDVQAV